MPRVARSHSRRRSPKRGSCSSKRSDSGSPRIRSGIYDAAEIAANAASRREMMRDPAYYYTRDGDDDQHARSRSPSPSPPSPPSTACAARAGGDDILYCAHSGSPIPPPPADARVAKDAKKEAGNEKLVRNLVRRILKRDFDEVHFSGRAIDEIVAHVRESVVVLVGRAAKRMSSKEDGDGKLTIHHRQIWREHARMVAAPLLDAWRKADASKSVAHSGPPPAPPPAPAPAPAPPRDEPVVDAGGRCAGPHGGRCAGPPGGLADDGRAGADPVAGADACSIGAAPCQVASACAAGPGSVRGESDAVDKTSGGSGPDSKVGEVVGVAGAAGAAGSAGVVGVVDVVTLSLGKFPPDAPATLADQECAFCCTATARLAVIPCGHRSMCAACACLMAAESKHPRRRFPCLVCRREVEAVLCVY